MVQAAIISAILGVALWFSGASEHGLPFIVPACLLGMVMLILGVRAVRQDRDGMVWDWRWGAPLLALIFLVTIQAANASHHFLPDSRTLVQQRHLCWLPRSVDSSATFGALLLLLGYASAFWLGRFCIVDRQARLTFVVLQVLCGAIMAVLVISQRSLPPPGALYPETGAFISANHYAAYANMVVALALFWGLDFSVTAMRRGHLFHVGWLFWLAAALIGVSVWRSGSRMGSAISLLIVATAIIITGLRVIRRPWCFIRIAGLVLVMILAGLSLAGGGIRHNLIRVEQVVKNVAGNVTPRLGRGQVQGSLASRWDVNRAVMGMASDRWVSGVGAGTFGLAFPYYQPHSMPGYYLHAHNEYLQCLSELGILGFVLLLGTVGAMCLARLRVSSDGWGFTHWERLGILCALCGVGLHAMIDFPFRLPALSMMVAMLVGMGGGRVLYKEQQ